MLIAACPSSTFSIPAAYILQAARKAGKVWAKLVYFVLSPLLGLFAASVMSCFVSRDSFAGSFVMTISWVVWPLVKAWEQLISATSWLHPSRASIHVILLIARKPFMSATLVTGSCCKSRILFSIYTCKVDATKQRVYSKAKLISMWCSTIVHGRAYFPSGLARSCALLSPLSLCGGHH